MVVGIQVFAVLSPFLDPEGTRDAGEYHQGLEEEEADDLTAALTILEQGERHTLSQLVDRDDPLSGSDRST